MRAEPRPGAIRARANPGHYHDSTESPQLDLYERLACLQDQRVLNWFRQHPQLLASPEDVHAEVMPEAPLTSARRAVTNLTKAGYLTHTGQRRIGRYGRPVGLWKLARAT